MGDWGQHDLARIVQNSNAVIKIAVAHAILMCLTVMWTIRHMRSGNAKLVEIDKGKEEEINSEMI